MKQTNQLVGVSIPTMSKNDIREKIIKNITDDKKFFHIISLNFENLVLTAENEEFKRVVTSAQMRIIDGSLVAVTAQMLGIPTGDRYAGVDLMSDLLKEAHNRRLRVVLIGGGPKVAESVIECQQKSYPGIVFAQTPGFSNISKPTEAEEKEIVSIVTATKPHMVFVAYGSPAQELWIDSQDKLFDGMVVMGVGGAFDFLSGKVPRAPQLIRRLGQEWFFRLMVQPWRIRRQLRMVKFMGLVLKERL